MTYIIVVIILIKCSWISQIMQVIKLVIYYTDALNADIDGVVHA